MQMHGTTRQRHKAVLVKRRKSSCGSKCIINLGAFNLDKYKVKTCRRLYLTILHVDDL